MNSDLYKRFNDPTSLVLIFLALLGLYGSWTYAQRQPGIDYYVAWTVANVTRSGNDYRIYDRQDAKRIEEQYRSQALNEGSKSRRAAFAKLPLLHVTASPLLYTAVGMVSASNYENSLTVWNALSLLGFSAAILLICTLLGFSKTARLVILVPCLFWMDAFHSDIRVANFNSIQLGLLALTFYLLSRDCKAVCLLAAGALIAIIAFLKPNLAPVSLILLGAWLIQGEGRKFRLGLAGMALGAFLAVLASSLFFGDVGIWFGWLERLFIMVENTNVPANQGNYSLLGFFGLQASAPVQIALAMLVCALTLGFLWWGRKTREFSAEQGPAVGHQRAVIEYAQLIAMGCLVPLMVSSLAWLHYYVLAMPMLIVAFRPWSRPSAHGNMGIVLYRVIPALVMMAFLSGPHWRLIHGDFYAARSIANIASLLALYLIGLWQLKHQDSRIGA